jgi:integral membrane protein
MAFKWVIQDDPHSGIEGGVPIMGPIHGGVFVIYLILSLVARSTFRWSLRTTLLALGSSIPPFFTIWFETWADRTGRLSARSENAARI